MTKALEAAVDLAGNAAIGIVEAVEHILHRLAFLRDEEILHGDKLGDREAVVHLDEREFLPRIVDARFAVGAFRGRARRHEVAAIRSEEHTSELQSRENLVCRLLLE